MGRSLDDAWGSVRCTSGINNPHYCCLDLLLLNQNCPANSNLSGHTALSLQSSQCGHTLYQPGVSEDVSSPDVVRGDYSVLSPNLRTLGYKDWDGPSPNLSTHTFSDYNGPAPFIRSRSYTDYNGPPPYYKTIREAYLTRPQNYPVYTNPSTIV